MLGASDVCRCHHLPDATMELSDDKDDEAKIPIIVVVVVVVVVVLVADTSFHLAGEVKTEDREIRPSHREALNRMNGKGPRDRICLKTATYFIRSAPKKQLVHWLVMFIGQKHR